MLSMTFSASAVSGTFSCSITFTPSSRPIWRAATVCAWFQP
jgi:hypothetical protein